MSFEDDQLIFKCFECKKIYEKDFNKELLIDLQTDTDFVMKTLINFSCY